MSLFRVVVTDRTGLVGAGGGLLAGLPPTLTAAYLLLRLLVPVLLIVVASRGATPVQRIGLVRDYLLGAPTPPASEPAPGSVPVVPPAWPVSEPAEPSRLDHGRSDSR